MQIVKKEVFNFSAEELDAIDLVKKICEEIKRETGNSMTERTVDCLYQDLAYLIRNQK